MNDQRRRAYSVRVWRGWSFKATSPAINDPVRATHEEALKDYYHYCNKPGVQSVDLLETEFVRDGDAWKRLRPWTVLFTWTKIEATPQEDHRTVYRGRRRQWKGVRTT